MCSILFYGGRQGELHVCGKDGLSRDVLRMYEKTHGRFFQDMKINFRAFAGFNAGGPDGPWFRYLFRN